jgi:hypothetical protein
MRLKRRGRISRRQEGEMKWSWEGGVEGRGGKQLREEMK